MSMRTACVETACAFVDFFFFYNSTVPCIVEFTDHLLSDEIYYQQHGNGRGKDIGITSKYGKGIGIKLG